jgi:hypothetical protein
MMMKMIEFVHDHGPRTVDFVLDGIVDFQIDRITFTSIKQSVVTTIIIVEFAFQGNKELFGISVNLY